MKFESYHKENRYDKWFQAISFLIVQQITTNSTVIIWYEIKKSFDSYFAMERQLRCVKVHFLASWASLGLLLI